MPVEQRKICILAHFDRAETVIETELARRGVEGNHGQGLGLAEPAVLHHLGRFQVEVADQLLAVALDADAHSCLGQKGGVERDRVVRLDLVGPCPARACPDAAPDRR